MKNNYEDQDPDRIMKYLVTLALILAFLLALKHDAHCIEVDNNDTDYWKQQTLHYMELYRDELYAHRNTRDELRIAYNNFAQLTQSFQAQEQTIQNLNTDIANLQDENNHLKQLLETPYQQFNIAFDIYAGVGTSVIINAFSKLYLYGGLYCYLGAGMTTGEYMQFNTFIPYALGSVGIGYTF